jgi:hypothetical protein
MPERFKSGVYDPDLVKVMGEALDLTLVKFKSPTREAGKVLAGAIIESAGDREPEVLAAGRP